MLGQILINNSLVPGKTVTFVKTTIVYRIHTVGVYSPYLDVNF